MMMERVTNRRKLLRHERSTIRTSYRTPLAVRWVRLSLSLSLSLQLPPTTKTQQTFVVWEDQQVWSFTNQGRNVRSSRSIQIQIQKPKPSVLRKREYLSRKRNERKTKHIELFPSHPSRVCAFVSQLWLQHGYPMYYVFRDRKRLLPKKLMGGWNSSSLRKEDLVGPVYKTISVGRDLFIS